MLLLLLIPGSQILIYPILDPHTVRIHRHRPGATDRPRSSLTPDRRQGWQPPSRPHRFGGVGGLTVPFMSRLER